MDMQDLAAIIREELSSPVPPRVAAVAEVLRGRHANSCVAVLFYGSCLRLGQAMLGQSDSILDFYVLVDDYRVAYPDRPILGTANRLLPPNVFYVEQEVAGRTMRAKYGLMEIDQFVQACRPESATSAIWARFAQPARLVYVRDETMRARLADACATAVRTFLDAALAWQGETFRIDGLWIVGFRYTYDSELRSEKGDERADSIVAADRERYRRLATVVLGAHAAATPDGVCRNPLLPEARRAGQARWRRWRRMGKTLNLLRLIKAVFTFEGAVDYALWKVERHAGVRPPVSDWERRQPILAAPLLLWRFHRAGAFR
jgi:hypothetical protein